MSEVTTFLDTLHGSAAETGSIACMGLDPVLEALPSPELSPRRRMLFFFEPIFKKMKSEGVLPGAFKPNFGFFHCIDRPFERSFEGTEALLDILEMLDNEFPTIPIILDMKRGDIARSSRNYAEEAFTVWHGDAITVSPYMGGDSVGPFIDLAEKIGAGVYILNRTSNPGGRELQNLKVEDGRPLYLHVADRIASWSSHTSSGQFGAVGAVVGATNLRELG